MSVKLGNTTIAGISRETKLNAHSLLDFKWTDHILNEMSWLRADTFSWQSGDVYTSVYNLLVAEYQNGTEETEGSITFKRSPNGYKITTDESGVSTLFNSTGVAWYYILDTENRRFKLPRTKYGFTGLRDSVGNYVPESLPNIKGSFSVRAGVDTDASQWTGGFYYKGRGITTSGVSVTGTNQDVSIGFDESRVSSTYQDNAPVQERATQMYLYFYVGEFSQTATEQTAGITTEVLNTKADKSDFYYKSGDTFTISSTPGRIYCGFLSSAQKDIDFTITLPKSIKNINTVTVNLLKTNIRTSSGGYMPQSNYVANGQDLSSYGLYYVYKINDYDITIRVALNSASTITNNTPLSVEVNTLNISFT